MEIVRLSPKDMRKLFNSEGYWEQTKSGALHTVLQEDNHVSPGRAAEHKPYCTRSQMVSYLDENDQEVARVHQFKMRDGTLSGSGRPDPKRLQIGGTIYKLEKGRR